MRYRQDAAARRGNCRCDLVYPSTPAPHRIRSIFICVYHQRLILPLEIIFIFSVSLCVFLKTVDDEHIYDRPLERHQTIASSSRCPLHDIVGCFDVTP
ncbi:hypothetical protein EVAR_50837_1 [Eumeta japonica]|uniref:Uncharacterized protein n=1 Tax=Eumeta variegata TaxID=151549 RepID=A0A4C1XGM2_EUMVA|nr:hypothetical protein EVAR_50837_1 [Eumeta japonica]